MAKQTTTSGPNTARIALWGKGFRVTLDSEEFQRLVPRKWGETRGVLDGHLDEFTGWPALLQPLYNAPDRDVALLRCVLLRNEEIMCFAFAKTDDKHRRPSLVAVTASSDVDWELDVATTIARTHALATRLAAAYARNLKGSPEGIAAQLKNGTFVQDRVFELGDEPSSTDGWDDIIRAVKEWRGISGVASPRLASLGANIIIGTEHEASIAQSRLGIDGYYDIRDRTIHPLSERLTRWRPEPLPPPAMPDREPPPASQAPDPRPPQPELQSIDDNLRGMRETMERFTDAAIDLMYMVADFWTGDHKRRKK